MRAYESLIEAETLEEISKWPEGQEFSVRESMMRITLDTILRGIFGADDTELDDLRALMPRMIKLGLKLVLVPALQRDLGRWSPWHRMKAMRRELDAIFAELIARAEATRPGIERSDVLSLLLQARYEDGTRCRTAISAMSCSHWSPPARNHRDVPDVGDRAVATAP